MPAVPVPTPYAPISGPPYHIYTLAFDGAISGMLNAVKAETTLAPAVYNYFTQVARAWAIAWDRAWASARALDEVQAGICWDASKGYWGHGNRVQIQPLPVFPGMAIYDAALDPATYTGAIDAMIAGITSVENAFTADGISVPLWMPGGGGSFTAGGDLKGTSTDQVVIGTNTMPLNQADTSPTASGVWVGDGSELDYRQLTADDIAPGLTVTISGGGAGTFETGATWTPGATIVANPACNAAGVTHAILSDSLANASNKLGDPNPLTPPVATYTSTVQGATVGINLTLTQNSITKTSNTLTSDWTFRNYAGCDNDATGTSIIADGNNATLVGGVDTPGAMIGQLGAGGVGTTFTITPSGTQYGYYTCVHTATAHTFMSGGFPFPMTRVGTNFSFTNQFAAVGGMDTYVTGSALTVSYSVSVAT